MIKGTAHQGIGITFVLNLVAALQTLGIIVNIIVGQLDRPLIAIALSLIVLIMLMLLSLLVFNRLSRRQAAEERLLKSRRGGG